MLMANIYSVTKIQQSILSFFLFLQSTPILLQHFSIARKENNTEGIMRYAHLQPIGLHYTKILQQIIIPTTLTDSSTLTHHSSTQ
ncbi:hypothetical protein CDL12_16648 [Handroanthus impetiginosus]|uniref:Uncharacterized protein n=1 Tax=Handroanthus impetiginosus TaxID=429701 RepID=A0A2G9GZP0_9LAMI|nr:hypothetical protein CDL12_16648 [Handroanthus impetiginosus]